jgi:hypothetical protein
MRAWIIALALALAGLAFAPATTSADEKYMISAETWSYYQEYLVKIKNGQRPGAYVITKDGYGSYYYWCSETQCMPGATYSQEALNACEREYDTDCVVFAVRDDIRVEYEVVGKASSATAAPALSPAPPVAKIKVSAAVKSEIDQYLRNTQRAGRVWALAIANDGSKVGLASCQSTGGGGYFGGGGAGCNLVSGGPQEQASREAVLRCGGPTICTLLYEGSQKKANVSVYGPGEVPEADEVGAVTSPATPTVPTTPPAETMSAAPAIAEETAPVSAGTYTVSDQVWRNYQAYLQRTGDGTKPGAFAITPDGSGYAYVWCEQAQCTGGRSYSQEALIDCKQDYGTDCVVFAVRNDIRVAYAVADPEPSRASGVSNVALSAPPPATKVVVSPSVKAAIDSYLGNTQAGGKAWALAITNDGSDVAFASCPTSGGWSGGRACEPIKGRPQELASREAVMRCGGPAACILLYEGAQPAGNVEIVTQ